mmetsp:Transcript_45483/g.128661  ORF Transcript_45483/g.128661 Transcript_45483/m.128661 type:complete len:256 (-) Transcript_45483:1457-2224(-)
MPTLSRFFAGRCRGFVLIRPSSLAKATSDPVNVMAPMESARTVAMRWPAPPGCAMKDEMEAAVAAMPTREWNAATVCGSFIGWTESPILVPTAPPRAMEPRAAGRHEAGTTLRAPAVAPVTPMTPSMHPSCAVFCEARPPIAKMHMREEIAFDVKRAAGAAHGAASMVKAGTAYIAEWSFSPGLLKRSSMRLETRKPPKMLIDDTATAPYAKPCPTAPPPVPTTSKPPTAVKPEIAFVTDIRGVCRACTTPHTAW